MHLMRMSTLSHCSRGSRQRQTDPRLHQQTETGKCGSDTRGYADAPSQNLHVHLRFCELAPLLLSCRCKMSLPASLSKYRRKAWHCEAQLAGGLQSLSSGLGRDRHLQISLQGALGPKVTVSTEARRLWDLAHDEGGSLPQLSLREAQAMLDTNSVAPALQRMLHQR